MFSEFPLWAFTILTGIACGAYIASAVFPVTAAKASDGASGQDAVKGSGTGASWVFPLVMLVLVAIGGLCAVAHLGRPYLMLNVLNNPTASITMEGICAGLLAVVAVVDLILSKKEGTSPRWIRIVGAVVAVVFLLVVTSAYVTSYGNPSWIAAPTFPLFVLGAVSVGCALWLALFDKESKPLMLANGVVSLLFTLNLVWEGVVFAGFEEAGWVAIAIGAVLAVAQAALSFVGWAGKAKGAWVQMAILVCAVLALAISRYGFYMASII